MNKTRVGIIFGGRSAEHEVSLQSAKNIIEALNKDKYTPILIGIDYNGKWFLNKNADCLLTGNTGQSIQAGNKDEVCLVPGDKINSVLNISRKETIEKLDVVFPVLHGPFGEDGTIQGLLKLADIPFVGAGVLGSAIGMDKDVMKRLLRDAELPIADYTVISNSTSPAESFTEIAGRLGLPLFIKPANLGSSVGVSKAGNEEEFRKALSSAFEYDNKIIVEEFIKGREIECSVLGNEDPIASVPGEIIPHHEFYSYEAKYLDEKGASLKIPAELSEDCRERIRKLALLAFRTLCCEGMARVDFFLTEEEKIIINEINTIPGFTRISMYPKLWEASGISYSELIDRLISLALERHKREYGLKTKR